MRSDKPKILVYGLDGVGTNSLFKYIDDFDFYKKLYTEGAHGVSTGYPSSPTGWSNFYLGVDHNVHGLHPKEGGVGWMRGSNVEFKFEDRKFGEPFWEYFAKHDISTGLYKTFFNAPNRKINGFMHGCYPMTGRRNMAVDKSEQQAIARIADMAYRKEKRGFPPKPHVTIPFANMSGGRTWEQCPKEHRGQIFDKYAPYLQYGGLIGYYDWHTHSEVGAMKALCESYPVNILMTYTNMTDSIQHFQMHEPNWYTIRQALHATQRRLELLVEFFKPDYIILNADHGIGPIKPYHGSTRVESERSPSKTGFMLEGAHFLTGAVVSGEHTWDSMYVAHGPKIKACEKDIHLYQLYELMCDIMEVSLPKGYESKTMDVFKEEINGEDN